MGQKGAKQSSTGFTASGKQKKSGDPNLQEIAQKTGFNKVEVKKLFATFNDVAVKGNVDKASFKQALKILEKEGLKSEDPVFVDRLFEVLDLNGDGVLDINEFVTGLGLLCKGSIDDKLKLSFQAYDLDGNGFITKDELTHMFATAWLSGYMALKASEPSIKDDFGFGHDDIQNFSKDIGGMFAESAFSNLDENRDGKLSFEEFKDFILTEPKITATVGGFKRDINIVL
eukprot:TRINITY_DN16114_c0_g1_i1.p1 TRINITY_DN16114_c0_g1~~TRINITY_DN16114_c0_g1_i1.p1  ORF type:complete len:229 (+),score=49.69 TRINITY_DN16114_c0_g1_i1:39-725(+)